MNRLKNLTMVCAVVAVAMPCVMCQVTEIAAPTISLVTIDFDNVGPAGPVTVAQINAGASPGPGGIASLSLPPSTAAAGVYNTNPGAGRALAIDATGGLILVDPPAGAFTSFEPATITFNSPTTEFGASIGDYVTGPFTFDCQLGGVSVGTVPLNVDSTIHYLQSVMPFDSVVINGVAGSNWVIGDLVVPAGNNILEMSQTGAGVGDLMVTLGMISSTATEGFTLVSTEIGGAAGAGPMFGLMPVTVTWDILGYPYMPGNPFHFSPLDAGIFPNAPFVLPPGAVGGLAGQTMDFVCLMLNVSGAYDSRSNVVRFSFQ